MRFLYLLVILINIHHISCMERNNKTNSELFERLHMLEQGSYASDTVESFPVFHRMEKGIFGQEDGTVIIDQDVFNTLVEEKNKDSKFREWINTLRKSVQANYKKHICTQAILASCTLPAVFLDMAPVTRYFALGFIVFASSVNTYATLRTYNNWKRAKHNDHHNNNI